MFFNKHNDVLQPRHGVTEPWPTSAITHRSWRRWLVVGLGEFGLVAFMAAMFWYQDLRYSLPTPRPEHWQQAALGTVIPLPIMSDGALSIPSERPVLLHFFNPDCPCSRFNLDHVRTLHRQFADRVDFVSVLEGTDAERLRQHYERLDLPWPGVVDADRSLAEVTGVYGTPQAVILDGKQRLCFRGNYNVSRYCVAPQTEYARLALEAVLQDATGTVTMPAAATTAYGCELPACSRKGAAL